MLRRIAWHTSGAAGSADEPLLRLESVQSVREALEELPPEQRQVVRMRIYEEKTFATIAKELKIPLGTALGRMRAATDQAASQDSSEPSKITEMTIND